MKHIFPLIFLLVVCTACVNVEERIISEESAWRVSRMVYEYTEVFDVVESLDTIQVGNMFFYEDGTGLWENGLLRVKQDTVLGDPFEWTYDEDASETTMRFDFPQPLFGNRQTYTFRIIESSADLQTWRSSTSQRIYSTLRRDSIDTKSVFQLQLDK